MVVVVDGWGRGTKRREETEPLVAVKSYTEKKDKARKLAKTVFQSGKDIEAITLSILIVMVVVVITEGRGWGLDCVTDLKEGAEAILTIDHNRGNLINFSTYPQRIH